MIYFLDWVKLDLSKLNWNELYITVIALITLIFVEGFSETDINDQLKQLTVAKEALVSKEDIADDTIGDEDWNVHIEG